MSKKLLDFYSQWRKTAFKKTRDGHILAVNFPKIKLTPVKFLFYEKNPEEINDLRFEKMCSYYGCCNPDHYRLKAAAKKKLKPWKQMVVPKEIINAMGRETGDSVFMEPNEYLTKFTIDEFLMAVSCSYAELSPNIQEWLKKFPFNLAPSVSTINGYDISDIEEDYKKIGEYKNLSDLLAVGGFNYHPRLIIWWKEENLKKINFHY